MTQQQREREIAMHLTCINCRSLFKLDLNEFLRGRKCCSQACAAAYRKKPKLATKCLNCGKLFLRYPSSTKQYCSKQCGYEGTKTIPTKGVCIYCASEFHFKPTARHPVQLFCSIQCANTGRHTLSDEERFWQFVSKTDSCWLWTGGKVGGGYGVFWRTQPKRCMQVAHRYAWEILRGPIPENLWVLHNCPGGDCPACCRPDHMFLGTPKDNQQDALKKGMHPIGERVGTSILKEDQVLEILELLRQGEKAKTIAPRFGVTPDAIWKITCGKNWKHLTGLQNNEQTGML